MTVSIVISADHPDGEDVTVSTTLAVDPGDPRWQTWLVDAVAGQAKEGARRLRDQLIAQAGLPVREFVPLAAILPVIGAGR